MSQRHFKHDVAVLLCEDGKVVNKPRMQIGVSRYVELIANFWRDRRAKLDRTHLAVQITRRKWAGMPGGLIVE
jgi:hypothetical protein